MLSPDAARSTRGRLRTAGTLARATILVLVLPVLLVAASPSPSQPGAGDPRSSGQGPGLVGDPLTALIIVGAIALASIVATLAYVRITSNRHEAPRG